MIRARSLLAFAALAFTVFLAGPVRANDEQILIDRAKVTVDRFAGQEDGVELRKQLARARAVLVIPEHLKASFLIGGEGGSGVLMARDQNTGMWSAPTFYAMGGGSFGLQIGGEIAEVMLLIMTERGLNAVLKNEFKLGADASITAGPWGRGISGSTTSNLGADILSFSRTQGIAAGISVDGSVINARHSRNRSYYGDQQILPRDILYGNVRAPGADGLRQSLKNAEAK